jgi:hypothetical protein
MVKCKRIEKDKKMTCIICNKEFDINTTKHNCSYRYNESIYLHKM